MILPFSIDKKLRIQFDKSLRRGFANNVCMDPIVSPAVGLAAEANESFIVRVDPTNGGHYWFSDRRVLREDDNGVQELFRYESVQKVHWMFKDWWSDPLKLSDPNLKLDHYDRIEVQVQDGLVVLEHLGQAYAPTLSFLGWIGKGTN